MSAVPKRKRVLEEDEEPMGKRAGVPDQPSINPYTGNVYTSRYYEILEKRQGGCMLC